MDNESFPEGDMQYPINDLATSLQLPGEDDTVSGSRDLTQSAPTDLFDNYDWSAIFQDENFGEIMVDVVFPDPAYSLSYDTTLLDHTRHNPTSASMSAQNRRANCPTSQPLRAEPGDLSRFGSRLPSLDPEDRQQQRPEAGGQGVEGHSSPWQQSRLPHCLREVTSTCRQRMLQELANFTNVVPAQFELPSRHTLTRFVAMYIAGFNDHNPVLHLPTLALDSIAVELFLSIASIGARYAHEREASLDLFEVARAVAFERVKRTTDCSAANVPRQVNGAEGIPLSDPPAGSVSRDCWDDQMRVEVIQALVLMIGSLWFGRTPGARSGEAASFRSLLEVMIRDLAESATTCQTDVSWEQWVRQETIKRIVLVTFTLMNLQTIILDCAPSLWWTEVLLDLPCSEEMWNAKTPALWNLARARDTTATSVQTTMENLFYTDPRTYRPFFSSLGGYFLIHAILQSIWILQQSRRLRAESANAQAQDIKHIQQALRQWRRGWERNQESSMNPISPSGPLTFTSTALLRLAYVRITTETRFIPSLNTWNPDRVVKAFLQTPPVERSEQATRAALHCAHALSIPVKIGLNFVARTQSFYWASQHALCSLECALFLSKWLTTITATSPTELTKEETLVLDFVIQIVAETPNRSSRETLLRTNIRLSKTVVSTWATLYPGGNVWEMVDLVGKSMKACADATCAN
ncbi:uncharacterized protein Z520_10062 [Fonsecaea multimorphosa CBS 102226]|uniref:Transcription factor domain-containing protein n=1 Tax=Fonsecaea multimorphosa CBS 102226 TaxID=1442371 RepID=A0A0D2JM08_9EURO|nr:uncharacterized protein Z520_10062 [Fonsecaea multimorphosa CBS 102226]KIX94352.1 hypothetical protein Z520_10062 [Fonsecaea multimorphosa CBS 102226]OAL19684.1 hypothetical protein AYO22_09556 [Fonsecaea multimorphosa]